MSFRVLLLVLLILSSCSSSGVRPAVTKIAVLIPPGLPALQWALVLPFAGLADAMIVPAVSRRQMADVAPHIAVEPVVDSRGITLEVFDGRTNRHLHEIDCQVSTCAQLLAQTLGITARPIAIPNIAMPAPPSVEAYQALARQHPQFSVLYEQWINLLLAQNRRDEARQVAALALQQPLPPLEKAQFEVVQASLAGDTAGRVAAFASVARAWPANAPLQVQAAEALNQRRDFKAALPLLLNAQRAEPGNLGALITLAYTQAYSGATVAALQSAAQAGVLTQDSASALDLKADVYFIAGDFAAAEAGYLAAVKKDAAFQLGRLHAKAAEAALYQNQLQRADEHMQRFFTVYQKGVPGGVSIVQGLWLWRLGRRVEAVRQAEPFTTVKPLFAFLVNPAAGGPPPAGPALQALAQGRAAEAAAGIAQMVSQQPVSVGLRWDPVLAVALAESGNLPEACKLLSHWGQPSPPDDWSGLTVWPKQLTVRAACLEKTDPARANLLRQIEANLKVH